MIQEKVAYVVPTMDRADDLRKLLQSIVNQTRVPDQMIVVDGSNPDIEYVCNEFPLIDITYVRCYPPSLAKQRNAGMAALNDDITIAGYLDDDVVLEDDATEKMLTFWEKADQIVGGVSFSVINQPNIRASLLYRLFKMDSSKVGAVLSSGFPVQIPFIEKTTQTEWLYGGATLFRRSVIEKFSYDEWYIGHGFLEDLDYSYRVSREYSLFVLGEARCWHFSHPIAKNKHFHLGRQQIINRLYFVNKMGTFNKATVFWALLGQFLANLSGFVRRFDKESLLRFKGNMVAFKAVLKGRKDSYEGHYK